MRDHNDTLYTVPICMCKCGRRGDRDRDEREQERDEDKEEEQREEECMNIDVVSLRDSCMYNYLLA